MATKPLSGPNGPQLETTRKGSSYLIRPFEERDVSGVVSFLATHQYAGITEAWFRQTYVENPYVEHVPLFVVESDDEIVGTRPFTAFRVRAGGEETLALLTRDTYVHPDHRRRGLFTEMTELALQHYETAEPAFVFSHSNHRSFPGYRKMGWSSLGHQTTHSRVQNARKFVEVKTRDTVSRVLSPVASPFSRAHLAVRDWTTTSPTDITVTKHERVPEQTMAALYRRRRPERPHVVRDEAFYRWRFHDNPEWGPNMTYIARRDGNPVAGIVTVETGQGFTTTSVIDVVPRTGGENWADAIARLLDSVIADNQDAGIIRVPEPVFPARVLRERGFFPSNKPPLSAFVDETRQLTLGVRPFDSEVTIGGYPLEQARQELWSVAH